MHPASSARGRGGRRGVCLPLRSNGFCLDAHRMPPLVPPERQAISGSSACWQRAAGETATWRSSAAPGQQSGRYVAPDPGEWRASSSSSILLVARVAAAGTRAWRAAAASSQLGQDATGGLRQRPHVFEGKAPDERGASSQLARCRRRTQLGALVRGKAITLHSFHGRCQFQARDESVFQAVAQAPVAASTQAHAGVPQVAWPRGCVVCA